ncbi:hypothetical protein, partial [Pseudomonas syringae]|uniref:hypothetical protein n=1 Tax=Pseudomonas syringae TaxID=317 RepID=UPI001F39DA01
DTANASKASAECAPIIFRLFILLSNCVSNNCLPAHVRRINAFLFTAFGQLFLWATVSRRRVYSLFQGREVGLLSCRISFVWRVFFYLLRATKVTSHGGVLNLQNDTIKSKTRHKCQIKAYFSSISYFFFTNEELFLNLLVDGFNIFQDEERQLASCDVCFALVLARFLYLLRLLRSSFCFSRS